MERNYIYLGFIYYFDYQSTKTRFFGHKNQQQLWPMFQSRNMTELNADIGSIHRNGAETQRLPGKAPEIFRIVAIRQESKKSGLSNSITIE